MKSPLRQFLRSRLRPPVVHLAGSAAGCALQVLFLSGGKDPWVGRERPPTSRVAPGQLCSVSACPRAAFLHAGFAAAVAKAQTNNLLIPRRENRHAPPQATHTQTRKSGPTGSNRKVVSRTRRTACRIYRRQPRIRCDGVRESVAKRDHEFQSWLRQPNTVRARNGAFRRTDAMVR